MMAKPQLLITAGSLSEVKRYILAGADAVNVGDETYGLRLPGSMDMEQMALAVEFAHARNAKIVVSVNAILDNGMLAGLPDFLRQLARIEADAILFGDPAVLRAARTHAPRTALHWSAEMTSTNYATADFWAARGASRAVLARELNLEEILEFKRCAKLQVEVQVHGITNIYHSRRRLLHRYAEHRGQDAKSEAFGKERSLYLVESERPNESFPIYEDAHGTHIMSADDICMLEDVHELLAGGIDSLRIEGLLKPPEHNEIAVRAYRQAIDAYCAAPERYAFDPGWLESVKAVQDPKRELSFGFFYKEQVY